MDYKIAQGHDNEGGLQDMVWRPRVLGLEWGDRQMAGDGLVKPDGFKRCALVFDGLTIALKEAFDAQAGLSETVESAYVTVTIPRNADRDFTNYNATIVGPAFTDQAEFKYGRYMPISYTLEQLTEIA